MPFILKYLLDERCTRILLALLGSFLSHALHTNGTTNIVRYIYLFHLALLRLVLNSTNDCESK